jgi:FkbM family methyltransferase
MLVEFNDMVKAHNIDIKGIIHVGAHEGQETQSYVRNGIKDVVLIEANPFRFSNLTESIQTGRYVTWCSPLTYAKFNNSEAEILKGYKLHNYAITDKEGTIKFNLSNFDGGTDSVFKINDWGRDSSWAPYEHTSDIEVPTITLDKLIKNKADYNFLNMDVEGAELLVLKGSKKLLETIDYILLESQDVIRFDDSCTRPQLVEYLKDFGFELKEYYDTGKQWGDCLFIKVK